MNEKCELCMGTGKNVSGHKMKVNNDICPRCGGYGTVSKGCEYNISKITEQDLKYIASNNGKY